MMATPVTTTGTNTPVSTMGAPSFAVPLSWTMLFASPNQVLTNPMVTFGVLLASLFASTNALDTLLMRLEALAQHSPIALALVSDEELNQITLLKNPHRYAGSLANSQPQSY